MAGNAIVADKSLVAFCGLYCGACGSYLKGRCQGCAKNVKASWCKIRQCCIDSKYASCADCGQVKNSVDCKKANNAISKIFGLIFRSDRNACIARIKEIGADNYAVEMAGMGLQSIKKK